MAFVADSGALYALYDAGDRHHAAVRMVVEKEPGPILVPVVILAEVDCLLREFLGVEAEVDFLDGIASGFYTLAPFDQTDLARCRELIVQHRDLDLGVADASVVAAAERFRLNRILTVDERDFRAVRSKMGRGFTLLPRDADS